MTPMHANKPEEKNFLSTTIESISSHSEATFTSAEHESQIDLSTRSCNRLCRWDGSAKESASSKRTISPPPLVACKVVSNKKATRRGLRRESSLSNGISITSIQLQPVTIAPKSSPSGQRRSKRSGKVVVSMASSLSTILEHPPEEHPGSNVADTSGLPSFHVNGTDYDFTAVFCIRRPGCGGCRETGLQLTQLSQEFGSEMNLFGIIKETGVDDAALTDFYTDYFSFPLYKDNDWESFRFLGNRKISIWKLLRTAPYAQKRYNKKKIVNIPFGGDIFTQGGILLFDRKGNLQFVYYERYGDELDMEALRFAIREIQGESSSSQHRSALPDRFSNFSTDTRKTLLASRERGSESRGAPKKPIRKGEDAPRKPVRKCEDAPRKPVRRCEDAPRKPVRQCESAPQKPKRRKSGE